MIDLIHDSQRLLAEAGYSTAEMKFGDTDVLVFENPTILGFLLTFESASSLLKSWAAQCKLIIDANQFGLRRAQAKSWNAYTVFLTKARANFGEIVTLGAIEEDLTGTRKIARAGVSDVEELRIALLPLLPIQSAPRLEAVDMPAEIRLRTSELPARVLDAFLSEASESIVIQVSEETP